MPTDSTTSSEEFALSGAFSVHVLVFVGIALTLLVLVLAWRDGRLTRIWLTPVFTLLRVAAIVIVLWMLAGPSMVQTMTRTKTKSIAVIVDASGSMGTTDPADEPIAVRWAQAAAATKSAPAFVKLDQASAALSVAASELARVVAVSQSNRDPDVMGNAVAQAKASLDASVNYLKDANAGSADLDRQRGGILQELTGTVVPQLNALSGQQRPSDKAQDGKTQLESAAKLLAGLSSRLSQLAAAAPTALQIRSGPASRIETVASFLEQAQGDWLGAIAKKARVAQYSFDTAATPVASGGWKDALAVRPPSSTTTDISTALEKVYQDAAGQSVDAVLLLSDGGHNNTERDPIKTVSAAATRPPVFVVPIGQISPVRDVMLHHVQGPRTAYPEAQIVIEATVDAQGYVGQNLTAELLKGDAVIETKNMAISSDHFVGPLAFSPKADALGRHEYTVRIKPLAEEKVADNNEAKVSVDVIEDKMTILLADSLPRWEFRYLKNLFRRYPHYTTKEYLSISAGDSEDKSASAFLRALPRDLESWAKYRIVILGDLAPDELTPQQQDLLEKYVGERGGTLIIIAGDDAMPASYVNQTMGKLLPVTRVRLPPSKQTPFDLYVSAEGSSNAAVQLAADTAESERLWRALSSDKEVPLYGLSEFCKPKSQSHVLIGAALRGAGGEENRKGDLAFLSWQHYGSGRVVYLSSPLTWRLRKNYGDTIHWQFWGQLLQWAIARDMAGGSKTVKIATDKTLYSQGDEVQVTMELTEQSGAIVAGATPRVVAQQDQQTIAGADLVEDPAKPGTYRGTVKKLPAGQITLLAGGVKVDELTKGEGSKEPVKATVTVDPYDSPELRNTRCNLPLLTQIAEVTHGAVLQPTGVGAAMSTLRLEPEITKTVSRQPLWARWTCLWVFVGCLTIEWTLRKLTGLA
jgi:hypothetical protein